MTDGLGVFWLVPILVSMAASAGGAAIQRKLLGPHGEELSPYDYRVMQEAEERKKREQLVLIGAGGVLLVVLLVSMTR